MNFMKSFFHPTAWPIFIKLSVALLLAALLPMIFTSYHNIQKEFLAVKELEYRNLELLATSTANRLDQLIDDTQKTIIYLATNPHIVNFLNDVTISKTNNLQSSVSKPQEGRIPPKSVKKTPKSNSAEKPICPHTTKHSKEHKEYVDKILRDLVQSNQALENLYLLDTQALSLASTNALTVGKRFEFRDYYQEAIKGNHFISNIQVGTTSKTPGLYMSSPVRSENGEIIGIIALKLKGEAIWQILNDLQLGLNGQTFLIDSDGIIVYHPNRSFVYQSLTALPPDTLRKIITERRFLTDNIPNLGLPDLAKSMIGAKREGRTSYWDEKENTYQIVGFDPLEKQNWVVGVQKSVADFTALLNSLFLQSLYMVCVMGIVMIILSLLVARSIVKPVKALTTAAIHLEKGEFDAAKITTVTSRDEIGLLAYTFNKMVKVLREREHERDIFGRVVSPEVREKLLTGELRLGGETLHVSVLFSDIRDFSTISENMRSEQVVNLLNEYLTEMADVVRIWGGYINNFIGDAIVVIFGAPIIHPDKEWRAVSAAIDMRKRLSELNTRRVKRGEEPLQSGVGISTGYVTAGQIGSIERLLYTVIGDAVNIASRLETLTKEYKYPILINGATVEAIQGKHDEILFKSIGPVKVKGRQEPVEVFAVLIDEPLVQ